MPNDESSSGCPGVFDLYSSPVIYQNELFRFGGLNTLRGFNEEELFDFIVENGSEDYELNDDEYNIYCDQKILHELNQKIIKKFGQTNLTGLIWKSENEITLSKDKADTLVKLLNILEENEDVQAVSSNFDVSDEVLASLTA